MPLTWQDSTDPRESFAETPAVILTVEDEGDTARWVALRKSDARIAQGIVGDFEEAKVAAEAAFSGV